MGAKVVSHTCKLGNESSLVLLHPVGKFPRQPFMQQLKDEELRGENGKNRGTFNGTEQTLNRPASKYKKVNGAEYC